MISSARAVGRVRRKFPEKVTLKLKSDAGVIKQMGGGDRTLDRGKHEGNWMYREQHGAPGASYSRSGYDESQGWRVNRDLVMENLVCKTKEHRFVLRVMGNNEEFLVELYPVTFPRITSSTSPT